MKYDKSPAVNGGGFAEIYRASYQGEDVALKCLRLYNYDRDKHDPKILLRVFCYVKGVVVVSVHYYYHLLEIQERSSSMEAPQTPLCCTLLRP